MEKLKQLPYLLFIADVCFYEYTTNHDYCGVMYQSSLIIVMLIMIRQMNYWLNRQLA